MSDSNSYSDSHSDNRRDQRSDDRSDEYGDADRYGPGDGAVAETTDAEIADVAIRTEGLTKRYDGDVAALDGLDLEVGRGEVFGFLGPNGAGKTTTIDLLLDYVRATAGSATVLGYDAHAEASAVRERVGVLPDGFDLWERSTGYRQLEFAIASKGAADTPAALLDRVGLDVEDARRPVGEYSRGMTQRLAMATALVGDPELLILDEPSAGLDPNGIRRMQRIVREEAASGTTVFFSSHVLGHVSAVCDRVGILDDGELVTVDAIESLRRRAAAGSRFVVRVDEAPAVDLAGIEGVSDVSVADGEVTVTYTAPEAKVAVVERLAAADVGVRDFETREATLDDVFAQFTGNGAPADAPVDGTGDAGAGANAHVGDDASLGTGDAAGIDPVADATGHDTADVTGHDTADATGHATADDATAGVRDPQEAARAEVDR